MSVRIHNTFFGGAAGGGIAKILIEPDTSYNSANNISISSVKESANNWVSNGFLIAGTLSKYSVSNQRAALFIKLDASGNSEWAKTIGNISSAGNVQGNDITQQTDEDQWILGTYTQGPYPTGIACYAQLRAANGEIIKAQTMSNETSTGSGAAKNIEFIGANTFITINVFDRSYPSPWSDGFIGTLNSDLTKAIETGWNSTSGPSPSGQRDDRPNDHKICRFDDGNTLHFCFFQGGGSPSYVYFNILGHNSSLTQQFSQHTNQAYGRNMQPANTTHAIAVFDKYNQVTAGRSYENLVYAYVSKTAGTTSVRKKLTANFGGGSEALFNSGNFCTVDMHSNGSIYALIYSSTGGDNSYYILKMSADLTTIENAAKFDNTIYKPSSTSGNSTFVLNSFNMLTDGSIAVWGNNYDSPANLGVILIFKDDLIHPELINVQSSAYFTLATETFSDSSGFMSATSPSRTMSNTGEAFGTVTANTTVT